MTPALTRFPKLGPSPHAVSACSPLGSVRVSRTATIPVAHPGVARVVYGRLTRLPISKKTAYKKLLMCTSQQAMVNGKCYWKLGKPVSGLRNDVSAHQQCRRT
jgi:hypothetical protein